MSSLAGMLTNDNGSIRRAFAALDENYRKSEIAVRPLIPDRSSHTVCGEMGTGWIYIFSLPHRQKYLHQYL